MLSVLHHNKYEYQLELHLEFLNLFRLAIVLCYLKQFHLYFLISIIVWINIKHFNVTTMCVVFCLVTVRYPSTISFLFYQLFFLSYSVFYDMTENNVDRCEDTEQNYLVRKYICL
jgi:hypothetical protein